jgi:hypothetical protein
VPISIRQDLVAEVGGDKTYQNGNGLRREWVVEEWTPPPDENEDVVHDRVDDETGAADEEEYRPPPDVPEDEGANVGLVEFRRH